MKELGWNLGYVDELFARYQEDPSSVSEAWQEFFADFDGEAPAAPARVKPPVTEVAAPEPTPEPEPEETGPREVAISGITARIVENMETSLTVPTATSAREIPVKLLEENRRIINQHQAATHRAKVSFTHLIAFAVVKGLQAEPSLNHGFVDREGTPHRIERSGINLGLAVDVEKRGERILLVPNVKDAGRLEFSELLEAYNSLIGRARGGKLTLEDFQDTTVTITNPGMIGTSLSVPRLMTGQGVIIGAGAIGYPPEYAGLSAEAASQLGLSKVMTLTSTYDHRVIQGAESGAFLATLHRLLLGGEQFYEEIFRSLGVPHEPLTWSADAAPPVLGGAVGSTQEAVAKQAGVLQLITAYRMRGHRLADIDPLGTLPESQPDLELDYYGLSVWDLDREFLTGGLGGAEGTQTLRNILETLRQTYCQYVGVEYMHNPSLVEREWLQERMESTRNATPFSREEQLRILAQLNSAEAFERFLHTTYVGHKRFSLEGCESFIPVTHALLDRAASAGVEDVYVGMAHRGRLNFLTNVVGKPFEAIFNEFEQVDPESIQGSGDVKYHLGAEGTHQCPDGKSIRVTLASNPSHLESVNPVVEGMARARQVRLEDDERKRVLPILVHGDAAFAGQGVVMETLNLFQLRGYRTGGTVHVVINNQIGFTTAPVDSRSSTYATDIAKGIGAPIFHVNSDQPETAVRMVELALDFRQEFHRDVVVDLVCYRRWGHNEGDEPTYTQPAMYERIKNMRSVRKRYTESLLRRGDIDADTAEQMLEDFKQRLDEGFAAARQTKATAVKPVPQPDLEHREGAVRPRVETGVDRSLLERVLDVQLDFPPGFQPHPKLLRQLEGRRPRFDRDQIDWGLAETLAFGSLVAEGTHVRLSGQDSGRGTFSHRHAVLHDLSDLDGQTEAKAFVPLRNLGPDQGRFCVHDSSLSEFGVLGFDYGYSVEYPEALVMWEAQFGDFVNGAQVIIDQFISSAEEKWGQHSNLVMLLPHGYEGQGPEHSSARLERFLQLCSEGNIQVTYPTSPDQYFHLLRRQVRRPEYKPLIVMTPKSLLRLPAATCTVESLTTGTFEEVLPDPRDPEPGAVRRVLLTSGKVFYDLDAHRSEHGIVDTAIVRVEQFYPFPSDQISAELARYPGAADVRWVQEEPRNMGAWDFLDERVGGLLRSDQTVRYIGRPWSASPASGSQLRHGAEQEQLVRQAFEAVVQASEVPG